MAKKLVPNGLETRNVNFFAFRPFFFWSNDGRRNFMGVEVIGNVDANILLLGITLSVLWVL